MTQRDIKAKMREWYKAKMERDDDSYNELYHSLYTMYAANLIDYKTWKMVVEYDHKLFVEYGETGRIEA